MRRQRSEVTEIYGEIFPSPSSPPWKKRKRSKPGSKCILVFSRSTRGSKEIKASFISEQHDINITLRGTRTGSYHLNQRRCEFEIFPQCDKEPTLSIACTFIQSLITKIFAEHEQFRVITIKKIPTNQNGDAIHSSHTPVQIAAARKLEEAINRFCTYFADDTHYYFVRTDTISMKLGEATNFQRLAAEIRLDNSDGSVLHDINQSLSRSIVHAYCYDVYKKTRVIPEIRGLIQSFYIDAKFDEKSITFYRSVRVAELGTERYIAVLDEPMVFCTLKRGIDIMFTLKIDGKYVSNNELDAQLRLNTFCTPWCHGWRSQPISHRDEREINLNSIQSFSSDIHQDENRKPAVWKHFEMKLKRLSELSCRKDDGK
mmetsp:Transcript_44365/g.71073  ORF Transcript_44365/g.71073 Transcript_44365/m.71073 type:complete len:372 (-) Transcript_44365:144-1259(-)